MSVSEEWTNREMKDERQMNKVSKGAGFLFYCIYIKYFIMDYANIG